MDINMKGFVFKLHLSVPVIKINGKEKTKFSQIAAKKDLKIILFNGHLGAKIITRQWQFRMTFTTPLYKKNKCSTLIQAVRDSLFATSSPNVSNLKTTT